MGIRSLELVDSVYKPTPQERHAARKAILNHDPNALDVLKLLGLDNDDDNE